MVAKINSFFWLANVKRIFSSETAWPNGAKLGIDGPWVCPFQNCVRQPHPPFKMAAVFKGNDYLPLKFASVSFYCQVSDTGSVGWASSLNITSTCIRNYSILFRYSQVYTNMKSYEVLLEFRKEIYLIPHKQ